MEGLDSLIRYLKIFQSFAWCSYLYDTHPRKYIPQRNAHISGNAKPCSSASVPSTYKYIRIRYWQRVSGFPPRILYQSKREFRARAFLRCRLLFASRSCIYCNTIFFRILRLLSFSFSLSIYICLTVVSATKEVSLRGSKGLYRFDLRVFRSICGNV